MKTITSASVNKLQTSDIDVPLCLQLSKFRRHLTEIIGCEESEADILHHVKRLSKGSRDVNAVSFWLLFVSSCI